VRDLGCSLVVLARECSLKEIQKIRGALAREASEDGNAVTPHASRSTFPLEVFVHGALCVAYSGQCLTSEALGGRSANRGECDIAPVHLIDPASGQYNKHLATQGLSLVPGWRRMQGLVFRRGDARFEGRSASEALKIILADPSALMINRNAGAGTRVLTDKLLGGARPAGYANQPKSHNAVAAAIAQGRADWGLGPALLTLRRRAGPGRAARGPVSLGVRRGYFDALSRWKRCSARWIDGAISTPTLVRNTTPLKMA